MLALKSYFHNILDKMCDVYCFGGEMDVHEADEIYLAFTEAHAFNCPFSNHTDRHDCLARVLWSLYFYSAVSECLV